jgi:hypothetical protein
MDRFSGGGNDMDRFSGEEGLSLPQWPLAPDP